MLRGNAGLSCSIILGPLPFASSGGKAGDESMKSLVKSAIMGLCATKPVFFGNGSDTTRLDGTTKRGLWDVMFGVISLSRRARNSVLTISRRTARDLPAGDASLQ